MSENNVAQPFAANGSGKSPEEIAFELVNKLKGQGVWGERNRAEILDMYAECLDAAKGLRAYEGQKRVYAPIDGLEIPVAAAAAVQATPPALVTAPAEAAQKMDAPAQHTPAPTPPAPADIKAEEDVPAAKIPAEAVVATAQPEAPVAAQAPAPAAPTPAPAAPQGMVKIPSPLDALQDTPEPAPTPAAAPQPQPVQQQQQALQQAFGQN